MGRETRRVNLQQSASVSKRSSVKVAETGVSRSEPSDAGEEDLRSVSESDRTQGGGRQLQPRSGPALAPCVPMGRINKAVNIKAKAGEGPMRWVRVLNYSITFLYLHLYHQLRLPR